MAAWPVTIPQTPLVSGYKETSNDARLRTGMDQGPDKVRRRFSAVTKEISCSFAMTPAELALFETFFDTTQLHGSVTFDWTHPRLGTSIVCRFKDMPTFTPYQPDLYRVDMTIEVLPS